jgi:hypothetical protein
MHFPPPLVPTLGEAQGSKQGMNGGFGSSVLFLKEWMSNFPLHEVPLTQATPLPSLPPSPPFVVSYQEWVCVNHLTTTTTTRYYYL